MAAAEAADAEAGRERTWAARAGEVLGGEVPEPWPEVAEVLAGWRRLGRDASGSLLYGRRLPRLTQRAVAAPWRWEAWQALFDAADDVLARLRAAELEALRERAEV